MIEARGFEWAGLHASSENHDGIGVRRRIGDDPSIGKASEQRGAKEPGGKEERGGKADKLKSAFTQIRKLKAEMTIRKRRARFSC
jgi:hypothetical protein